MPRPPVRSPWAPRRRTWWSSPCVSPGSCCRTSSASPTKRSGRRPSSCPSCVSSQTPSRSAATAGSWAPSCTSCWCTRRAASSLATATTSASSTCALPLSPLSTLPPFTSTYPSPSCTFTLTPPLSPTPERGRASLLRTCAVQMWGTLVITLPSVYSGAVLHVYSVAFTPFVLPPLWPLHSPRPAFLALPGALTDQARRLALLRALLQESTSRSPAAATGP